jgi:hypothetical protein
MSYWPCGVSNGSLMPVWRAYGFRAQGPLTEEARKDSLVERPRGEEPRGRFSSGRGRGGERAPDAQWSATLPSAGSSGSPRSSHAVIPPSIECASYPARRNAFAAIPERAPRRQ